MSINSFQFLIFFGVVYFALWVVKWLRADKKCNFINTALLLAFSMAFMLLADWRYLICICLIALITYFGALFGKKVIRVSIVIDLLFLAVFKYFNFFIDSICGLIHLDVTTARIIVPLGVSFYVFSSISYLIDVYREKYQPNRNPAEVALFVMFFPKVTSGPLVRADRFFEDLGNGVSLPRLNAGIQIFFYGFFKKAVLADHLAVFVGDIFGNPAAFNGVTVLLAIVAYSLQIYFDFSGYSDMAIGISKAVGFDIEKNFDLPYISQNPTEFWKRWHISLSSWLQEYLYYPLGGNRKGAVRTYINCFLVMLLGGLWHGANWTFIIWGALHGFALVVHKCLMNIRYKKTGSRKSTNRVWIVFSTLLTYIFVTIAWVFFRADSLGNAAAVLGRTFSTTGITQIYTWLFAAVIFALAEIAIGYARKKHTGRISQEYIILDLSGFWGLLAFFTFVGVTILLMYVGNTAFIYGQF